MDEQPERRIIPVTTGDFFREIDRLNRPREYTEVSARDLLNGIEQHAAEIATLVASRQMSWQEVERRYGSDPVLLAAIRLKLNLR